MKIDIVGSRGIKKEAFVKAYLFEHGEAYVSELYRAWKRFRIATYQKPGTVESMRQLIKQMKDNGLIEVCRVEPVPGEPHLFPRHYYRLTQKAFEGT